MSLLPGIFKRPNPEPPQPDLYIVTMSHTHSTGGNLVGLHQQVWNEKRSKNEIKPFGYYYSLHPVKEKTTFVKIPNHFEQLPNPCTPKEIEAAKKRILARLPKKTAL